MYWKFLWNLVFHPLVDEFTLTLDISTIFNGLRNEFQFDGRSARRRGKIKKKSQEHYFDYKLASFCWDWLNKWG